MDNLKTLQCPVLAEIKLHAVGSSVQPQTLSCERPRTFTLLNLGGSFDAWTLPLGLRCPGLPSTRLI